MRSARAFTPAAALLVVSALALPAPSVAAPRAAALGPVAAGASSPQVTLAEVNTMVDPAATHLPDLTDLLRQSAETELRAIDWGKERLRRGYKVSAAVTRLESVREGRTLRASCAVSAAVRDERGALLVIVEGRVRAEEEGSALASVERGALEGAVHGAMHRLPEAIRNAQ
ncbi:Hypothetical protein CAP_4313 [Chondromyces apiculatus DSM 436]|uniref:FlgO domain-containing protein n=1 Tax=Chondromyces apiculatus DSM 436 TaxID=1192034 RepID=A0A017T6L2_9BACT|nr:Hypothetical protein CAP_4313 [Chondromyces apiculatus DSM 436]